MPSIAEDVPPVLPTYCMECDASGCEHSENVRAENETAAREKAFAEGWRFLCADGQPDVDLCPVCAKKAGLA